MSTSYASHSHEEGEQSEERQQLQRQEGAVLSSAQAHATLDDDGEFVDDAVPPAPQQPAAAVIEEIDIDALQHDLYQTAASLRQLYYAQITSDVPQLDVLFHCAIGLSGSPVHSDHDLCVEILESLLEQGYMQQECRLELARALAMMGYIVRARAMIKECLRIDPDYAEAREFAQVFDVDAKADGTIALVTIAATAVCAAAVWWFGVRGRGGSASATAGQPSSSVSSSSSPSNTDLSSAIVDAHGDDDVSSSSAPLPARLLAFLRQL